MKALVLTTAVAFAAAAFAMAGGTAELPGNGSLVFYHEGGLWLAEPDGTNPRPLMTS